MSDLISRKAALDTLNGTITLKNSDDTIAVRDYIHQVESKLNNLPPAQPEITLESAIDYLHAIGWMQEHDRIMVESAQPEIIRCEDCKWKQGPECVRFSDVRPYPDDFCSRAETYE